MKNKKLMLLTITAIIISLLMLCIHFKMMIDSGTSINLGGIILLLLLFVILMHGLLMFILIVAAKKLNLGAMIIVWCLCIFIYSLPLIDARVKEKRYNIERDKRNEITARINNGNATIDDFLSKDFSAIREEEFFKALKHGYPQIAKEMLNTLCDSDHIFGRIVERNELKEKYGKEIGRNKVLGQWLAEAASNGNLEAVKLLLAAKADINMFDRYEKTPLMNFAYYHQSGEKSDLEIARLLLEHGADVHLMNRDGCDAIYLAVERNSIDIVRLLIEYGADTGKKYLVETRYLHERSKKSLETLLSLAQKNNNNEMQELLITKLNK